jgi:hypothetical protein
MGKPALEPPETKLRRRRRLRRNGDDFPLGCFLDKVRFLVRFEDSCR